MTKKYLLDIAGYSNWADTALINWLEQLNNEQWEKEIESSFPSIEETVLHIVSAKKIWIDFWQKVPNPTFLSARFKGTKNELIALWRKVMDDYQNVLENYDEEKYSGIISLKVNGEEWQMEFMQTVLHQSNHGTYHRGQLVTMLRQAGFTTFSNTDLATYFVKVI